MRFLVILTFLTMLVPGLAGAAQPATAPATTAPATAPAPASTQPAAPQPAPAAPAKAAPTIIPGSPLAALTGAGAQPPQETLAPAPFGTDELGFAITAVLGQETTRTFDDFTDALERSTRLTPVLDWLQGFADSTRRRASALDVLRGIVIAVLPGIALDFAVFFLLRKPMEFCARHGVPRRSEYLPHPDTNGLANAENGESEAHPSRRVSLRAAFRRFCFALLKFGLALLPLVAFGIAEQFFLSSGLVSKRPAYLAVIGIANAYLMARLAQEAMRLLLSPGAPSLRLAGLSTPHAVWAMRRVMVLIVTIFVSFCLISVAEILDLSKDGAGALIRLAALAATLEVAFDIWQSRRLISRWIAGRPEAEGFLPGWPSLLQDLVRVRPVLCAGAGVAWAGGVQNAVGVLLRAVLVVLAALVLGRLAWTGSNNLLARIFPDIGTGKARDASSHLLIRAHSYNPLIRFLVRAAIAVLVLMLMLQGWGVGAFTWLLNNAISRALLSVVFSVVITVAIAILLWEFSIFHLERRVDKLSAAGRTRQATRLRTLTPMLRAAIGGLSWCW